MDDDQDRPTDTFFIIPHTHWEGAVFKTREEYLEMGLPNILVALDLLGKHPGYRFTLDQSCYVEPFIQRYPEEGEALRGFVREGRLEIAGGTHVMPDVNMPGGESFIRQVLYGRGFFRREIGVDVSTAWLLDTFGHHPQMPQLLRLSGYRFLWFFRGVEGWDVPSEFVWEGIDGSRIPAIWLPRGYAIAYGSPGSLPDFSEFIEERFRKLDSFTRGNSRAGPAGADVCRPEEHLPRLIEEYNRRPGRAFDLLLSTPSDYERAVEARSDDLKVFGGELNPIFQGTYSSRIELKQLTRKLEGMIGVVEKLGAILQSLGKCVDNDRPWLAWEPLLFNHAHDLMSGVMTDRVYGEVMGNYGLSLELAGEEIECRMRDLSSMIDTRGEGIPIVVFNPLGWSRTDPVEVELDLGDETLAGLRLVGPDGKFIPLQLLSKGEGTVKIAFIAGEVPPLGHSIYRLVRGDSAENIPQSTPGEKAVLENRFYRIEIEPATGAVQQIKVRNGEWDALDGQGNVVAVEEDNGDFWELYRPLDGGSRIAMKDIHPPPRLGEAAFSTDRAEAPGRVMHGPVFSEFTLSHSLGEYGRFDTRIRLYRELRRIEFHTGILNNDRFVRYRVLFPTSVRDGRCVHEIPFGAIERPCGIEFPAQNWIDFGDGEHGLALINRGLPGNNAADGTLMLSLMRSTRIVAYGFGGGYEPGMGSDSGFELGRELEFDYALLPHDGDWPEHGIHREGMEFNIPLVARQTTPHAGSLPAEWGFLQVDHSNVVVSALKHCERGGIILRVYEATGAPAEGVEINFSTSIASVEEVDLMEDGISGPTVVDGRIRLDLGPFEIKSLRLEPIWE